MPALAGRRSPLLLGPTDGPAAEDAARVASHRLARGRVRPYGGAPRRHFVPLCPSSPISGAPFSTDYTPTLLARRSSARLHAHIIIQVSALCRLRAEPSQRLQASPSAERWTQRLPSASRVREIPSPPLTQRRAHIHKGCLHFPQPSRGFSITCQDIVVAAPSCLSDQMPSCRVGAHCSAEHHTESRGLHGPTGARADHLGAFNEF